MGPVKSPMFWMLVVTMILMVIIAVENWELYGRMAHLESTLGVRATPR